MNTYYCNGQRFIWMEDGQLLVESKVHTPRTLGDLLSICEPVWEE